MLWRSLTNLWNRTRADATQSQTACLRIVLQLSPAQIVAIHSLLRAAGQHALQDSSVGPRAVEVARGVLSEEQRLKLDQLAASAENHPALEEARRYNLLKGGFARAAMESAQTL